MKTTIEIADDLFARVQKAAKQRKTTFRSLTERGLRLALDEQRCQDASWKWKPATFKGRGHSREFERASWERIREEIYQGRGA